MNKWDHIKKQHPEHADEMQHVYDAIAKASPQTRDARLAAAQQAFSENVANAKGTGAGHLASGAAAILANLPALLDAIDHGL